MTFEQIENTYNFLNQNEDLKNFVINFDEPRGFAWSLDKRVVEIHDGINDDNISSPNFFALILRACQSIYIGKRTLESFKRVEPAIVEPIVVEPVVVEPTVIEEPITIL
jgi:hypothetical protein